MTLTPKSCIFVIASLIASLATFPYGYNFAEILNLQNYYVHILLGCLFGGVSSLANAILGVYSLSEIKITKSTHTYTIATLSTLGAIPTGFFSYFGYIKLLPTSINITASVIVFIVNAGINFTAIVNLSKSIKESLKNKREGKKVIWSRMFACNLGKVIGLLISMTAYLATTNGIAHIVLNMNMSENVAIYTGSTLAIIAWLPLGALYLHGTGVVTEKIHDFMANIKNNLRHCHVNDFLLIIFVLLSGTAFSRMVYVFYDPHNLIPDIFKLPLIQTIAYHYLMPLALISAAAVNYFAFINLIKPQKDIHGLDIIP